MNYCNLCRAEYQEGVTVCATCHAALLRSLESQEALSNAARLLWTGKNSSEFEIVAGALRDAEIPAFVEEKPPECLACWSGQVRGFMFCLSTSIAR